jgi:hypothetical protein
MSLLHVPAAYPCCITLLHVPAACPRCLTKLHVCAACPIVHVWRPNLFASAGTIHQSLYLYIPPI